MRHTRIFLIKTLLFLKNRQKILLTVMGFCSLLSAGAGSVAVPAVPADRAAAAVDPTKLEFRLLSSRRFMLDNELILSEFVPGAVVRPSLQNPVIPVEGKAAPKVRYANGAASFEAGDAAGAEGSVFPRIPYAEPNHSVGRFVGAGALNSPYRVTIPHRIIVNCPLSIAHRRLRPPSR